MQSLKSDKSGCEFPGVLSRIHLKKHLKPVRGTRESKLGGKGEKKRKSSRRFGEKSNQTREIVSETTGKASSLGHSRAGTALMRLRLHSR